MDSGVPVIKIANVKDGYVSLDGCSFVSDAVARSAAQYEVSPGDILISMTGYIGEVACVRNEGRMLLNQRVGKFSLKAPDRLDRDYLFHCLRDPDLKAQFVVHAYGAAQPNISPTLIEQQEIPLPPLPIQRRIAAILSAYDELIENSQRRIRILEAMARALYREWFVHFRFPGHENHPRVASPLGEIPEGWEVKRLGQISSYVNRGITPRYAEDGDSLVINQKCVRDHRLSLEPARRQSKAVPSEKLIGFGDVLINSTGVGTLGRVAQVYDTLEKCTVDTHVTIARPGRDIDLDFYGCYLLSLQETFERLGIGATGQTELGRAAICEIEVVVPPIGVQSQFGATVRAMRTAAVAYGKQIQNLRRTRDLLLPRLLSGQVEVEAA
jgi:type I restriction enzyme S subunit